MCSSNNVLANESQVVDLLHGIASRVAAADPLHDVLERVIEFVSSMAKFDSCFVYVLEENELVLRASRNLHAEVVDRLRLKRGHGITVWVAVHKRLVAVERHAFNDPRFQSFNELPEECFEAFAEAILMSDEINRTHEKMSPLS